MDKRKKTRIRRRNGGYKKIFLSLIILCITILIFIKGIVPVTITFSRYVYKGIRNFYFNSVAFYFNSDKLAEDDSAKFESNNWSGADTYSVTINMNSRKNINEVSKVNIDYNIKADCKVFKADGTEYTGDLVDFVIAETTDDDYNASEGINKTIFASNNMAAFDFSVSLKPNVTLNNDDYVFVTITATSISPYKKTLSGTFKIIIGRPGMSYQIEDEAYSPYCSLIITNTRDYYIVDSAFGNYNAGSSIEISEYLKLTDDQKAKCHSMKIELNFDPNEILLDTASTDYANAKKNNLLEYTNVTTASGTNQYVNKITFNIDAEESKVLKFYKNVAANDYTYPTVGTSNPVIKVDAD